jgi:hypothetical protein
MAAVALKREIEGYQDVVSQYQREARKYRGAATKHNVSVDAYNKALETGMDKYPANEIKGYGNKPIKYTGYVGMGSRVERFYDPVFDPSGSRGIRASDIDKNKWAVGAAPGGGYYIYRNLPSAPGAFTQKPPEEPKPNPAKDYTASQLKSLDEPSLTDVERTGGSGLVSSAFNY